jgi:Arc/MetJ-type ribon-helix-helix transcriptional regulator
VQVSSVKNSQRPQTDSRKQAISIRMNRSDVRNVKRLAERLGARDSDVIRFAIKLMLSKLALLQDSAIRGRNLIPVFIEAGPELLRHFELDAAKLASIINDGVDEARLVDRSDIELIAMNALQRSYLKYRMVDLRRFRSTEAPTTPGANGNGSAEHHGAHGAPGDDDGFFERSLRQYLYQKYLYEAELNSNGHSNNTGGES